MDWSLEKTEMLVDSVKRYPVLYDGTINSRKKKNAWNLVAKRMGLEDSMEHCKNKWIDLKKEYTHSLKFNPPTPFALSPKMGFLHSFVTAEKEGGIWLNSLNYLVKLTGFVREHPCLYNRSETPSRPAIWEQIATNMNDGSTAILCQTRWFKLRCRYSNSLRLRTPMKPTGIDKHLEFLKAYVIPRQPSTPPVKKNQELKFLHELIDVVRQHPILYDGTTCGRNTFEPVWQKVAETLGNGATASDCRYRWRKMRKNFKIHLKHQTQRERYRGLVKRLSFLEKYVMFKRPAEERHKTEEQRRIHLLDTFGRQCKALRVDVEDQDTMFLLNFLHDMANMNEVQVRRFRVEAVKAVREVLDVDELDSVLSCK